MNAATAEYFWSVLTTGLISPTEVDLNDQHARLFDEDLDMPSGIEGRLNLYFNTHDTVHLLEAAIEAARSFRLTCERPEDHLILVAFLLHNKFISRAEACDFTQVDGSNFSLMSEDARNLVRLAEVVAEEQRMGVRAVDSDDFLESSLLDFAAKHQSQKDGSRTAE